MWMFSQNIPCSEKILFGFDGGFFVVFLFIIIIPIRVPFPLCNFLKIKSSRRESLLSVKTRNFYHYFSK